MCLNKPFRLNFLVLLTALFQSASAYQMAQVDQEKIVLIVSNQLNAKDKQEALLYSKYLKDIVRSVGGCSDSRMFTLLQSFTSVLFENLKQVSKSSTNDFLYNLAYLIPQCCKKQKNHENTQVYQPNGSCPICLDDNKDLYSYFDCRDRYNRDFYEHRVCKACYNSWKASNKNTCPICRAKVSYRRVKEAGDIAASKDVFKKYQSWSNGTNLINMLHAVDSLAGHCESTSMVNSLSKSLVGFINNCKSYSKFYDNLSSINDFLLIFLPAMSRASYESEIRAWSNEVVDLVANCEKFQKRKPNNTFDCKLVSHSSFCPQCNCYGIDVYSYFDCKGFWGTKNYDHKLCSQCYKTLKEIYLGKPVCPGYGCNAEVSSEKEQMICKYRQGDYYQS